MCIRKAGFTNEQYVARIEQSEIRESSLVDGPPGFHFVQSGLQKIFQCVGDLASLSIPAWKNIFVFIRPKSPAFGVHPVPQEGTLATSLTLGQAAVDA